MRTRSQSKRPAQGPPEGSHDSEATASGVTVSRSSLAKGVSQCSTSKEEGNGENGGAFNSQFDSSEMDWEDGDIPSFQGFSHDLGKDLTVEFTDLPSNAERKASRRATAEEKESAELVHCVHLLCLLARGRIVDKACNDPLIQASMLSLLPSDLLNITEVPKLTANNLRPLVNWFHSHFHLSTESVDRGSFESNLAFALQKQEGTPEQVAALSVVLFRALNLTTRFVSILDVASLKPDSSSPAISKQDNKSTRLDPRLLSPTATTVTSSYKASISSKENESKCKKNLKNLNSNNNNNNDNDTDNIKFVEGPKRKGDTEFEMQLEMALSATAAAGAQNKDEQPGNLQSSLPVFKKSKQSGTSVIWSRTGPPLHWAEVYCGGETLTGRWVHVDALNCIIDKEQMVESAVSVCKIPLRYVIGFAGNGAKDVTRRYCMHWYKIASGRVNSEWWDRVLAPLKDLESRATGGVFELQKFQNDLLNLGESSKHADNGDNSNNASNSVPGGNLSGQSDNNALNQLDPRSNLNRPSQISSTYRDSLEDMELETRALTEPLPTNQLAYKNHHLYAIEKWLTKNQVLHPKGPILGYCSGHPVYPRSCVQTLQTRQKWLRDGLQVKRSESPTKKVRRPRKTVNFEPSESSVYEEESNEQTIELYGKWQLEPLQLPHAVNGIVPKNEHGNVEVWSERCLPPGTVHLRLPRLVPVAKRLEIDFAPALTGFEFRNGRTYPVFEGIVVCSEFKQAILEAYGEEEERREVEERERDEAQALSRWFQLLSSIATRQRLENSYAADPSPATARQEVPPNAPNNNHKSTREKMSILLKVEAANEHEHVFPLEDQSFDEDSSVRTKRCPCGFSIQVEEL